MVREGVLGEQVVGQNSRRSRRGGGGGGGGGGGRERENAPWAWGGAPEASIVKKNPPKTTQKLIKLH